MAAKKQMEEVNHTSPREAEETEPRRQANCDGTITRLLRVREVVLIVVIVLRHPLRLELHLLLLQGRDLQRVS